MSLAVHYIMVRLVMIVLRKVSQPSSIKLNEQLSGAQNGINKVFTTPHSFKPGKIIIDYNGQSLYSPDDFTESGVAEITLLHITPYVDDTVRAHYEVAI
jgi:hypothetical protein